MATRKWIPIVVGLVVFVVIVGLGLVGGLAYMVSRQVSVQHLSSTSGLEEFEKLRAPFAGQQAFIELPAEDSDDPPVVHRELATGPTGRVTTLHFRVWVPREGRLVRVDLPMWTLRLMGNKPIHLEHRGQGFDGVSLNVTPQELDRRGPGLVLDYTAHRGERILAWLE